MLERAVNISQRKLGLEDPQTASALQARGLVYRSTNESAKAEELFQLALEIAEKSLGSGHPRVASYLMQMAVQHQDRSDFEALRQAQLTMLKRKGRQHPFYWASFIQSGEWANLNGER
jgi:tetratricopeptide (TPR) repeat protein